MATPQYHIGDVIEHQRFHYRGVIFAVDNEFSLSEEWYDAIAKSRPPKNRPWYHVLVDGSYHTTYVAERHLSDSRELTQINHPRLGEHFDYFCKGRYHPKSQHPKPH